ncbi:exodeoxyribonuclease V subunit alpha [Marinobacter salinus]|uniref:RecBCD enzyme subunit RecD n=1 Tax=Marinobacter salinus TaxID=1874317 RepID=A0A1D9GP50_9GAMM|nr:exodeoxyribonuclease V subunit alpha [Marinobacter salinus]AOY89407.1 exodeoxyribonuclease V subunit alpha [Marinobacter salinus]
MSKTRQSDQQISLDLSNEPDDKPAPSAPTRAHDTDALLASPDKMDALLDQWQQMEWIRPLDVGFARLIRTLSAEQGEALHPLVLLLSALVSHQVGRGHVCIDLANLFADAGSILSLPPEDSVEAAGGLRTGETVCPEPDSILARVSLEDSLALLDKAQAVSDGSLTTPLVLNETRLYLRRFWRYEQRIAEGIQARLAMSSPLQDAHSDMATTLGLALTALFGPPVDIDFQRLACALAARSRFSVITGGPGTGKTTTVVKLLAALQAIAGKSGQRGGRKHRIRLAAPTGKAAARLNESIGGAVSRLPLSQLPGNVTPDDIPTRVTTLHRLLGSRPDTRRFRHNRDNLLLVDILVIDEASMIDMDLMASVFDALPATAQLILLGDKDQLASVDAGAVLGELCQRAADAHYTPETSCWLEAITGHSIPDNLSDASGQPLDQAVAMLRKSHRFSEDSGIRTLAEAVNTDTLDAGILRACRDGEFDDVIWLNGRNPTPEPSNALAMICSHAVSGTPEAFREQGRGRIANHQPLPPPVGYHQYLSLLNNHELDERSPRVDWDSLALQVLEAFSDFQILCALRKGPWGVEGINDLVARHLLAEKHITRAEGWYPGRPVLVTGNDYNLGLMNGDVGITFSVPWDRNQQGEPKDTLRVAFPATDGSDGIRWISPSRLQQLETVYAMTVHKSQGSEFNHTCLVLPDRLSPIMTRELIYTGITRARNWFSLITGDASVLRDSVHQQVRRASGLAQRLSQP